MPPAARSSQSISIWYQIHLGASPPWPVPSILRPPPPSPRRLTASLPSWTSSTGNWIFVTTSSQRWRGGCRSCPGRCHCCLLLAWRHRCHPTPEQRCRRRRLTWPRIALLAASPPPTQLWLLMYSAPAPPTSHDASSSIRSMGSTTATLRLLATCCISARHCSMHHGDMAQQRFSCRRRRHPTPNRRRLLLHQSAHRRRCLLLRHLAQLPSGPIGLGTPQQISHREVLHDSALLRGSAFLHSSTLLRQLGSARFF
jgi:hypothetical protein